MTDVTDETDQPDAIAAPGGRDRPCPDDDPGPEDDAPGAVGFLPPLAPRRTANGGRVFEGLSYALRSGFRPLLLDLWTPPPAPDATAPPLVLWLHGGGLLGGDRRYLPPTLAPGSVFEALTGAGIAVASADYRLAREAPYPAQLHDLTRALVYLRTHAGELGVDPSRLGLWGESAGGMLAALTALAPGTDVSAVVCWYPVTYLDADAEPGPPVPGFPEDYLSVLLGYGPHEATARRAAASRASAVDRVRPGAPPFLLVHGTADHEVPYEHSRRLDAALRAAGNSSLLAPVVGADHCFRGHEDVAGLVAGAVDFLSGHLKP